MPILNSTYLNRILKTQFALHTVIAFILSIVFVGNSVSQNLNPETLKNNALTSSNLKSEKEFESPFDAVKGKKEDVSKRDLFSKHYINEDGSFTALIGSGPIHFEKNGQFFDIDHAIQNNTASNYPYVNKTNLFESYFGATAHQGVKNKTSDGEIKEFLNTKMYWEVNGQAVNTISSANVPVSIQGDKAYYNQLFGNISAEFITLTGKRKLNYVIPSAQDLGSVPANANYLVFTEDVVLPFGWTHSVTDRGILIKKMERIEALNVSYLYENPTSTDVATQALREENTVFETSLNGNVLTIKTKVKTAWLLSSDRQFPVMVDPTVNALYTYISCVYEDGYEETGGYYFGRVSNYWLNAHVKYDGTSIPTGSIVSSVVSYVNLLDIFGDYYSLNAFRMRNSLDPQTNSGVSLYSSASINYSNNKSITSLGINSVNLNAVGITAVQSMVGGDINLTIQPAGSYYGSNYYSINNPYLSITYTTPSTPITCSTLSNLTTSLGTPFNGLNHHLRLDWAALTGATGYDIQFSTDGTNYSNATPASVVNNYADIGVGDYPNAAYWYRVRAKNATTTCDWTLVGPIYTAADVPEIPLLTNAVGTSLDLTLQAETPVANPAHTNYSIYCTTTGQFVQANGTLGSAEVWQTKSGWGTITITGLTTGTTYCFYAKAKNQDGHVVGGGTTIITQPFTSNVLTHGTTGANNSWFAPNSNTPIAWNTSFGCPSANGGIGYNGTFNNFWGNFLRLPVQNLSGMNEVTLTFDLSNSIDSGTPLKNNFRFYIWDGTAYRNPPTTVKIGSTTYTQQGGNYYFYLFDIARTCEKVTVTYDISGITNKAALFFYIEANSGYNNSNPFSIYLDNISLLEPAATACITMTTAPAPIFHNDGSITQLVFNNSRLGQDDTLNFRLRHLVVTATEYEIEINTNSNFNGTAYTQVFTGTYPPNTQKNFVFENAAGLLNSNNTTYYVRARIKTSVGYGAWSTKLHSFTYQAGISIVEWYQQMKPQFLTDERNGVVVEANPDYVTLPAPSGTVTNPFSDPSFETGSGWIAYKTGGSALETSTSDGSNWKSHGNKAARMYMYGGYALNSDVAIISKVVDLTGIEQIIFDAQSHYGQNMFSSLSNGGTLKMIIGGTGQNTTGTTYATISHCVSGSASCSAATLNIVANINPADRIPNQVVKFVWTGFSTGDLGGALVSFMVDNIRAGVNNSFSGTIISTPFHLASVPSLNQQYTELFWDQEINGSLVLDMQHYSPVTLNWQNVPTHNAVSLPGNGSKIYALTGIMPYDSVRIKATLSGNNTLKMNDWGLRVRIAAPLPVELTNFNVQCKNEESIIRWTTASEQNSDRFIVEKSRDGQVWELVTTKAAAGTSNTSIDYAEKDRESWMGITYYRLRQIDYNGEQKIYGPISGSCEGTESTMTVYPNPNNGSFTIEISSNAVYADAQLVLTDMAGKIITSQKVNVANGTTQILMNNLELQMGTYLVTLQGANQLFKPVKVMVF